MLRLTRKLGLGVFMSVVPMLLAAVLIVSGFDIGDGGRVIALLISVGIAAQFITSGYAASKIEISTEAIEAKENARGRAKESTRLSKGYVHP